MYPCRDWDTTVPKYLNARLAKKVKQVDAAKRAGIPQSLWSAYEHGTRSPSIQQAERLAQAIGTTLRRLV